MEGPEIRYKIKAKIHQRELEIMALTKDEVKTLFDTYKNEILRIE